MKAKALWVLFMLQLFGFGLWAAYSIQTADISGTAPATPGLGSYAYDPTMLCTDGNAAYCASGAFKIWAQAGPSGGQCGDNIARYAPSSAGVYALQAWEMACNVATAACSGQDYDAYAGPDFVKDAAGRQFLVFSHGNGDFYNGPIQFKVRSGDAGSWDGPYSLFWIAEANITSCDCFGGFARVSALDMPATVLGQKNYIYFYFETWKNSGLPQNEMCPVSHETIGYPTIFLARVEKTSSSPYLKREAGGAQVYIASLDQWVDMEPHMLQTNSSAVGIPQPASNGYIFGWGQQYTYPNGGHYGYIDVMNVLDYGLGDVTKGSDGRIIATTSMAAGVMAAYTNESTDGVHFSPVNDPILNFESVTGLGPLQQGISTPSLYQGGTDSCGRPWFYIGYNNIPVDPIVDYSKASVRIGTLFSTLGCPHPRPVIRPIFKGIMTLLNLAYVDGDGDGFVDSDILTSLNLMEEVGYERFNIIGGQEEGFPILVLAAGCHQKKNGKVECSSEESDLPGLLVDLENRRLYLQSGFFEAGDTVDLQIILRAWDKDRDDKEKARKPKECKKEDKCVQVKIRVVD